MSCNQQAELFAVRVAHLAFCMSPQTPAEALLRHTCPYSGLPHLFPSLSACPKETPHRTGLGLSNPMSKLKPPPLLQLGSRLRRCASNRAEPAGAGRPSFLPRRACSNKYWNKRHPQKIAFPLLSLKQPVLLHPPNLHSFLRLTAGQAIHPLPTIATGVLLSTLPPFLSPGDFASSPSISSNKGWPISAEICSANIAWDLTSIPQQAAPALRIRWLLSLAHREPLHPPGKSFLRTLLVPHQPRCVPAAQEHRNPLKAGTGQETQYLEDIEALPLHISMKKSLSKLCVFVQWKRINCLSFS